MAEVAKAPDLQSALAVLGVVLDREALLLAAEEAEDPEPAKAKVLSARPGNYAELACELSAHLRQGVAQGKRAGAPRPPKRAAGVSKGSSPYVSSPPFREGASGYYALPRHRESCHPSRAMGQ